MRVGVYFVNKTMALSCLLAYIGSSFSDHRHLSVDMAISNIVQRRRSGDTVWAHILCQRHRHDQHIAGRSADWHGANHAVPCWRTYGELLELVIYLDVIFKLCNLFIFWRGRSSNDFPALGGAVKWSGHIVCISRVSAPVNDQLSHLWTSKNYTNMLLLRYTLQSYILVTFIYSRIF